MQSVCFLNLFRSFFTYKTVALVYYIWFDLLVHSGLLFPWPVLDMDFGVEWKQARGVGPGS